MTGEQVLRNMSRVAVVASALTVSLAAGTAAEAATFVNWSISQTFGKASAQMLPNGDLSLYIEAKDLKADGTAVAVESNIVSGDNVTFFQVTNYQGNGTTYGESKFFDGGNVGFSGHVKIRVCKVRKVAGGNLTWGCSAWTSRAYSL